VEQAARDCDTLGWANTRHWQNYRAQTALKCQPGIFLAFEHLHLRPKVASHKAALHSVISKFLLFSEIEKTPQFSSGWCLVFPPDREHHQQAKQHPLQARLLPGSCRASARGGCVERTFPGWRVSCDRWVPAEEPPAGPQPGLGASGGNGVAGRGLT